MDLRSYRTLGRTGLAVSPMTLGTMTFGTKNWGADETGAFAIMDAYREAGGNFVDTAETYAQGRSEEIVGRYIAERAAREQVVLATKYSWNTQNGNPNAGGNGRKNMIRAVEGSLRRLQTDYIDVYWLHFWDMTTPAEEVLETFVDLVRAGKIRHFALSDVPAWYMAKMATLAQERRWPMPIALQLEYSLVERTLEREHGPAAREFGMAVMPWSPLAGGFLSGKYQRETRGNADFSGEGRLAHDNPLGQSKFVERNWAILDVLREVAAEAGRSPAEVALAWTVRQPGVTSVLIGASRTDQLASNIAALDLELSPDHLDRLEEASAIPSAFPYYAFSDRVKKMLFSEEVTPWDRLP